MSLGCNSLTIEKRDPLYTLFSRRKNTLTLESLGRREKKRLGGIHAVSGGGPAFHLATNKRKKLPSVKNGGRGGTRFHRLGGGTKTGSWQDGSPHTILVEGNPTPPFRVRMGQWCFR